MFHWKIIIFADVFLSYNDNSMDDNFGAFQNYVYEILCYSNNCNMQNETQKKEI